MTSGSDARIVLDTSAYSHFRSGSQQVLDRIAAAASVLVPTVVLGELDAAFRLGSREKENRIALTEFLDEPFVTILEVTVAVAEHYGRIFVQLRKQGTPIPVNDIWIAACTLAAGATLLTSDGDFRRVKGLSCVVVESGPRGRRAGHSGSGQR